MCRQCNKAGYVSAYYSENLATVHLILGLKTGGLVVRIRTRVPLNCSNILKINAQISINFFSSYNQSYI